MMLENSQEKREEKAFTMDNLQVCIVLTSMENTNFHFTYQ